MFLLSVCVCVCVRAHARAGISYQQKFLIFSFLLLYDKLKTKGVYQRKNS